MSRVLLVEDSASLARVVMETLEGRGHEVVLAPTLAAAWEALSGDSFQVVLCDYELPTEPGGGNDGRGTTFLNDVMEIPAGSRPFTILWSGYDRTREVAAEMRVPPDHVTTKDRLPETLDLIQ